MRLKIVFIFMGTALIFLSGGLSLAQEMPATTTQEETEPEVQWIWAEAVSVDAQKNELLVKYLDYETETEKEITITVDDKTAYENRASLVEIKIGDSLSIDYIVNPDGKNVAKNISVETIGDLEILPEETTPQTQDVIPSTKE